MSDEILVTSNGAITTLSLNRPDKLNAINGALRAALHAALVAETTNATSRVVVLRGRGAGFSAGQDLADVADGADLGALLTEEYAPIVRLIRTLPKPVLCAVHGVAAGAAANLALSCDLVVATSSARFIQAFIKIGLLPDVGGTWILPRLIGSARARSIAMLGLPIDGTQAADWGMIHRAVTEDRFDAEVDALATTLAGLPTHAIALMKRAFDAAESKTLDQQLDLENVLQSELGHSPDFREGKQAFLEKRPPRFTGRMN